MAIEREKYIDGYWFIIFDVAFCFDTVIHAFHVSVEENGSTAGNMKYVGVQHYKVFWSALRDKITFTGIFNLLTMWQQEYLDMQDHPPLKNLGCFGWILDVFLDAIQKSELPGNTIWDK